MVGWKTERKIFSVCVLLCFFELFSPSHAHQKSQLNGKMRQNGLLIKVVCWKQNRFFTKWVINSYYCWLLSFNCFFFSISFRRIFFKCKKLKGELLLTENCFVTDSITERSTNRRISYNWARLCTTSNQY